MTWALLICRNSPLCSAPQKDKKTCWQGLTCVGSASRFDSLYTVKEALYPTLHDRAV